MTTSNTIIPANTWSACIKVIPIIKDVETVLVGPVKNKPALLKSSKPAYCCQTNAIPKAKVINKNAIDSSLLLFFNKPLRNANGDAT